MAYCIWKSYKLKAPAQEVFQALSTQQNCFFLDSSLNSCQPQGRYSFLGIDPFFVLKTKNQEPFQALRELLAKYQLSLPRCAPPFMGGAVGYLAYDLGFLLEDKLNRQSLDDLGIADCFFGFYNTAVIIDHFKKLLHISALGFPEKTTRLQKSLCELNLKKIHNLISRGLSERKAHKLNLPERPAELKSNFTRKDYIAAINRAKRYIKAGDIYQVNLSQRFQTETGLSASQIYQKLRAVSPTYFSAYLDCRDYQIISSSPERFLKLEQDTATTRPMKGTRPRFNSKIKNLRFRRELLESEKDKAELMMIVDLERNDLGRVCAYDSIKVDSLREIEEYNTVFQTTAAISGKLHKDKDRIDLLRACFPGGSITGCPKIRAMEIIDELEPHARSIYTGCLGYLSFSGGMDFNILIRSMLKIKTALYFGVGGGIVADSQAQAEYEETLVKAKGMIQAINASPLV